MERRDSLIKDSDNDETGQQIRNYARESARDYLRNLYAACLAAGRAEEAQEAQFRHMRKLETSVVLFGLLEHPG